MLAQSVLDAANDLLQDAAGLRWTIVQRLRWLNEGQLAIVSVRPDACAKTAPITLVAGDLQTLPANALRLLDVVRNVGGRGITLVGRDVMTDLNSSWFSSTPGAPIKHYAHDPLLPKEFNTYPPATPGTAVLARYSVVPADCATAADPIAIDDNWKPALVDWICYRAFMRDTDTANNDKAMAFKSSFMLLTTVKSQADKSAQPSTSHPNRLKPNPQ